MKPDGTACTQASSQASTRLAMAVPRARAPPVSRTALPARWFVKSACIGLALSVGSFGFAVRFQALEATMPQIFRTGPALMASSLVIDPSEGENRPWTKTRPSTFVVCS
jgi:hypothetical protein